MGVPGLRGGLDDPVGAPVVCCVVRAVVSRCIVSRGVVDGVGTAPAPTLRVSTSPLMGEPIRRRKARRAPEARLGTGPGRTTGHLTAGQVSLLLRGDKWLAVGRRSGVLPKAVVRVPSTPGRPRGGQSGPPAIAVPRALQLQSGRWGRRAAHSVNSWPRPPVRFPKRPQVKMRRGRLGVVLSPPARVASPEALSGPRPARWWEALGVPVPRLNVLVVMGLSRPRAEKEGERQDPVPYSLELEWRSRPGCQLSVGPVARPRRARRAGQFRRLRPLGRGQLAPRWAPPSLRPPAKGEDRQARSPRNRSNGGQSAGQPRHGRRCRRVEGWQGAPLSGPSLAGRGPVPRSRL